MAKSGVIKIIVAKILFCVIIKTSYLSYSQLLSKLGKNSN